jgi:hypothetical protein
MQGITGIRRVGSKGGREVEEIKESVNGCGTNEGTKYYGKSRDELYSS